MSRFLRDAESLFDAAAGPRGPSAPTDLAIAVGPNGAIRITDACGWDLAALQAHSGARSVYRVSRNSRRLRVEGRSGARSCLLTAESPGAIARRLLNLPPAAEQPLDLPGRMLDSPLRHPADIDQVHLPPVAAVR